AVINRQNFFDAPAHLSVPELKMSSVALLPLPVQINQNVQPAVQRPFSMPAEIRMNSELPAFRDLVKTSPEKIGVRYDILHAGELFQEAYERRRIELIQKKRGKCVDISLPLSFKFLLMVVFIMLPNLRLNGRKSGQHPVQRFH